MGIARTRVVRPLTPRTDRYRYTDMNITCQICGNDCDRYQQLPTEWWCYCESCNTETFHPFMKILLYSPTHHHRDLYTAMEQEYKAKGYRVVNPYSEPSMTEREVFDYVIGAYNSCNMVMCISPCGRGRWIHELREACRKGAVLFRRQDGDERMWE